MQCLAPDVNGGHGALGLHAAFFEVRFNLDPFGDKTDEELLEVWVYRSQIFGDLFPLRARQELWEAGGFWHGPSLRRAGQQNVSSCRSWKKLSWSWHLKMYRNQPRCSSDACSCKNLEVLVLAKETQNNTEWTPRPRIQSAGGLDSKVSVEG